MTIPTRNQISTVDQLEFTGQRRRFYFDTTLNAMMVWVGQGDYYVTQKPSEVITTVLGSCVAVCIRDPELNIGGMNHFILPQAATGASTVISNDLRYGSYSIERLINSIVSCGGDKSRLEVKIFGGAVIASDFAKIGDLNVEFVLTYLAREKLKLVAQDLSGALPRRLMYFPRTGKALVRYGRDTSENRIFDLERKLRETPYLAPKPSKAELF
jgi:chemotaxis protein CheD